MSSKSKASAAIAALQAARRTGARMSAAVEIKDESIYEEVDDAKYARIVEQRRREGDFVEDDGGLGYADDGEEHWDEEGERSEDASASDAAAEAAGAEAALSKRERREAARKAAAAKEAAARRAGSSLIGTSAGIFGTGADEPAARATAGASFMAPSFCSRTLP
jgi:hypothetical protein